MDTQKTKAEESPEDLAVSVSKASDVLALWESGHELGAGASHSYLDQKNVGAFGVRVERVTLLIPFRDAAGVLTGVQRIYPDGDGFAKRWLGVKQNSMHIIGEVTETILIAEGYATAASLH